MKVTYLLHDGSTWQWDGLDNTWLAQLAVAFDPYERGLIDLTEHPGDCLRQWDDRGLMHVSQIAAIQIEP